MCIKHLRSLKLNIAVFVKAEFDIRESLVNCKIFDIMLIQKA